MAIPDAIKANFHTLEKAFRNGHIALLECRDRNNGEPAYAICAINLLSSEANLAQLFIQRGIELFQSAPHFSSEAN